MIVCIHKKVESIKSQRILMNAARHMDLTIMQAGEKGHEHVATEDFGRPNSNSESYRNP